MKTRVKLSPAQRKAMAAYKEAEKQEDRYAGSVFVNPIGLRKQQEKTTAAYQACKALGMTTDHGL